MSKNKESIAKLVEAETSEFLADNGLELYHVDFRKEGKDWYLNVYIDIAEGSQAGNADSSTAQAGNTAQAGTAEGTGQAGERYVSTDDCEKVSDFLSERLDELDPIEQNYMLCVSSPGIDRELYEQKDFDRFAGETVDVKLYKPADGSKEFQGKLIGLEDGVIRITLDNGEEKAFAKEDVAKTSLAVVF